MLTSVHDFRIPTLKVLRDLGGTAWIKAIEEEFYKRHSTHLDPEKPWAAITRNRGVELWRDYCTTRVALSYLRPEELITIERHGNKGSKYILTPKGRAAAQQ